MIEERGNVDRAALASIEAVVAGHVTLEDVVRWSLSQQPARLIERVVIQDEYTHDVVLRWSDRIYLAYDTT